MAPGRVRAAARLVVDLPLGLFSRLGGPGEVDAGRWVLECHCARGRLLVRAYEGAGAGW